MVGVHAPEQAFFGVRRASADHGDRLRHQHAVAAFLGVGGAITALGVSHNESVSVHAHQGVLVRYLTNHNGFTIRPPVQLEETSMPISVGIIVGSLRQAAYTRFLQRAAMEVAPSSWKTTDI